MLEFGRLHLQLCLCSKAMACGNIKELFVLPADPSPLGSPLSLAFLTPPQVFGPTSTYESGSTARCCWARRCR